MTSLDPTILAILRRNTSEEWFNNHSVRVACRCVGFNRDHEHLLMSDSKINAHISEWMRENVGSYFTSWSWTDYGELSAGSIYSFLDEKKAILFRLNFGGE